MLSQNAFAKKHDVSKQAVSQAVASGRVVRTAEGINEQDPVNLEYVASLEANKGSRASYRKSYASKPKLPKQDSVEKPIHVQQPRLDDELGSKTAAELQRIKAQTLKYNIQNAELLGDLIQTSLVRELFGDMTSVLLNLFFPLSTRLSPIVAGICGTTDQVKILEITKEIDKEVMRGLGEFKRQSVETVKSKLNGK